MTTMLEKVAKAITDEEARQIAEWTRDNESRDPIAIARAALLAIRVPDETMLAPACRTHRPGEPMSEARPEECPAIARRRARFTAMIDAILGDDKP